MQRPVRRGSSEVNNVRDQSQGRFIWLLYLGLTEGDADRLAELIEHLRGLASAKERVIGGWE